MNDAGIKPGDRVQHILYPEWGVGIVLLVNEQAMDAKVEWLQWLKSSPGAMSPSEHYLINLVKDPLGVIFDWLDENARLGP